MSQRRLILGCGYLGRRVAARWVDAGDTVFALTRSQEHAAQLQAERVVPIIGDVLLPDSQAQLPSVDTVLWAVGWDRASGHSQHDVYVHGLKYVMDRMTGRCAQWISISSTSVYGQSQGEWIDESSSCEPTQPNGQVCLEAEQTLATWPDQQPGAPVTTILRLSGIYGPGRLLSRVATLQQGEPLAGNPEAWLNLIHVDDAATAVLACAAAGSTRSLFLISDNEPLTRRTYYTELARLVSAPEPRFAEDASEPNSISPVRTRTNGLNKRCCNRQARQLLNWKLEFPTYREGLVQAVNKTD